MKRASLLALLSLPLLAQSQAKFNLFSGQGQKLGTAVMDQKLLPDGSKSVSLTLLLDTGTGRPAQVRSESIYDAAAMIQRLIFDVRIPDSAADLTVVTFDAKGANLNRTGAKKEEAQVPFPDSVPLANKAEFWFLRDQPKVGDSVAAYTFSTEDRRWALSMTEFLGKAKIKLGKQTLEANHIITTRSGKKVNAYLDAKGIPLLIDSPVRLERILEVTK